MLRFRRFLHKKSLNKELFPSKLLTKKHKTPSSLYIGEEEAAGIITKLIKPYLKKSKCDTILEINPGVGFLTRKLLLKEYRFRKIILIEAMEQFLPGLQELHSLHPNRVRLKHGDFVNLWKLVYQDKMDHGTRVSEMLTDVPKKEYSDDPNLLIFGAVGSYNFFKQLINSVVFQTGLFNWGRCEMFLAIPPPIYIHLTCSNEIGYLIYRSASMLFQLLFEYRFIARVPRNYFLPPEAKQNITSASKLSRIKSINPEYLYLVRIIPRRNIYDLCPAVDLPAFWYFVKQNCVSRRNRIIPNLEKWVPGCGPRLIINTDETKPVQPLYPDENIKALPQYSNPCRTISSKDFYPHLNIFTQFGDLSPSQMFTLYMQFRQWPEYSESSFLAAFENSLLKMETSADDTIDGIAEEDDVSGGDITGLEETSSSVAEEITHEAIKPKRKKKAKTAS